MIENAESGSAIERGGPGARRRSGGGVFGALAAAGAVGLLGCRAPDLTEGRYQGMIEYDQRALAFETAGRIAAVVVQRGQRVRAGELVARQDEVLDRAMRAVDDSAAAVAQAELDLVKAGSRIEDVRAAEAQLVSARAAETTATAELARQRTLVERSAAPRAGLDVAEASAAAAVGSRKAQEQRVRALRSGARVEEIARAAARVSQARQAIELDDRRLEKRALAAPLDGVVQDIYLDAGEVAGAGAPVLALADVVHPYADVFVPVPDVPRVRVGDHARLRLEGLPVEVPGVVELVHPEAEFTPRFVFSPRERPSLVVRVRVRLEDRGGRLHAGLPAYATFEAAGSTTASGGAAR
ncbi:MAG TPA: HlyD family efflux transporter periplasmic adaptor subunit [Kofleriaceae bacterium]|nr:HlyD family efflux transporter periplasmic adaptor subunit [Kofleriaceae bacterium]